MSLNQILEPPVRIELTFEVYDTTILFTRLSFSTKLEPRVGIEPTSLLYESSVLPLNYIGLMTALLYIKNQAFFNSKAVSTLFPQEEN